MAGKSRDDAAARVRLTPPNHCLYHNINVNEDREAALAETKRFLDLYYSIDYSRPRIEAWSALGSPEECVESLRRFRGTGMERGSRCACAPGIRSASSSV